MPPVPFGAVAPPLARPAAGPPRVGTPAPDFELPDQTGARVRRTDLLGRPVVLYFYPHDFTPVCTREACGFRDEYGELRAAGAQVLGVSGNTAESHRRFAAAHGLPFRLLSDPDGRVRRLYGVRPILGLWPRRVTFVLDAAGTVRARIAAQLDAGRHVEGALAALRKFGTSTRTPGTPGQPPSQP